MDIFFFEFTLVLEREPSEGEEEALAESAPSIVGVEGGGVALAHAAVKGAPDFAAAVAAAVHEMEASGPRVVGLETNDLVTVKEIAARTGRSRESIRLLSTGQRGPGGFPTPVSPDPWGLYSWTAVADWFSRSFPGQTYDLDRQALIADHLLRARHIARDEDGPDWSDVLSA